MLARSALFVAAVAVAACGGKSRTAATPAPEPPDPTADAMRAVIEPLYSREVLHGGMVIALIDPAREAPTYLRFGRTSPEVATAPDADAIFEIGSVSKVLTALLLADSAARGEVTLDTPAAALLPFGVRFPDVDGERPTLAQLASHRAGFPPLPDNLQPAALIDPYAGYGERQLYAYLEHAQLMFPPGEAYAYSNLGAGILGHLLERKAGVPYEKAVREHVLEPLGLAETWIELPDSVAGRFVPGTTPGGEPAPPWQFDVLAGAGAWRSTTRDMVKLIEAATAAASNKDVPLAAVMRQTLAPLGDAGESGMQIGLAWHITAEGVVWHNGMTGGYASFIGFEPKTGKGVVVLASTASPLVSRIGIGTFDVFAGKPLDIGLEIVELADADADALVGQYRLADNTRLGVVRDGDKIFLTMGPEKVRIFPRSKTEFVVLELEAVVEFVWEEDQLLGFVLHMPGGDVPAERIQSGGK